MEDILGGLAFAGFIAAQFLAVVAVHKANQDGSTSSSPNSFDEATDARDIFAEGHVNRALSLDGTAVLAPVFPVGSSR